MQCSVNFGLGAKNIFLTEDHWLVVEAQSSSFLSSRTLSDICPLHRCFLPTAPFEWIRQTKKYRSQVLALWNSMTSRHKTWNTFLPIALSFTTTPLSLELLKWNLPQEILCSSAPQQAWTKQVRKGNPNRTRLVCLVIARCWWYQRLQGCCEHFLKTNFVDFGRVINSLYIRSVSAA